MIVYFDENMSSHVAKGFNIIQEPENYKNGRINIEIKFLPDVYDFGTDDLDWIPQVGKEKGVVITQDVHISKRKNEIDAYLKYGVRLFFLRGKTKKRGLSVWEMVQVLSKNWEEMVNIILTDEGPFTYTVQQNRRITHYR